MRSLAGVEDLCCVYPLILGRVPLKSDLHPGKRPESLEVSRAIGDSVDSHVAHTPVGICQVAARYRNVPVSTVDSHSRPAALLDYVSSAVVTSLVPEPRPEDLAIPMPPVTHNGTAKARSCAEANCGPELGCQNDTSGFFVCVCPHDLSQPRDGKCPRVLVSGDPAPIPISIPRSINRTETAPRSLPPDLTTGLGSNWLTAWTVVICAAILALLAAGAAAVMVWRRHLAPCSRKTSALSASSSSLTKAESYRLVPLSKSSIGESRFKINANYCSLEMLESVPWDPAVTLVPVLQKDNIVLVKEIGQGCFGKVYQGVLKDPYGKVETVAVKILKETASNQMKEDFYREAQIMASFKHPNILSLRAIVASENHQVPWILFEFMPHGDLAQLLRNKSQKTSDSLSDEDLYFISEQIAAGMVHLSSQHLVHRDLACRNCLVGEKLLVKISDFGMCRDVYTCDYYKAGGSRLLPVRWMSPESIMYGKFTTESDVWSFGVVLWEIFSYGKQPYYGHSNEEVIKLILQGILLTPPEGIPPLICDLMKGSWKTDPGDRLKFAEIHQKLRRLDKPNQDSSTKNLSEVHYILQNEESSKFATFL